MQSASLEGNIPTARGLGLRSRQRGRNLRRRIAAPRTLTIGTAAVVVYMFVVHSYKLNVGTATIGLGLFGVLMYERPLRISPPMYWYAAYLAWALLTLPTSVATDVSFQAWTDSAKILLIMFLTLNVIRAPNQHRLITLAWLGMFALYPVRGTLINFLTGQGEFGRYGWNFVFANFNDMAALTLIPLALSLERLRSTDKKWVKLCALAGVISLPFVVLVTQSRAGLLGLSAMLLFLLFRSRYRKKMVLAIAGIATVAMLFAPSSVWDRIQHMTYLTSVETLGQSDSSAEQRYLIWQVAENIIADNPAVGVGIGAYPVAHQVYARKKTEWAFAGGQRDTHSTYLHVLAENGVLGLALFLMIFLSAYYELYKTSRALKRLKQPADKELMDRCQAYQSAFVGLTICAIFGSMESMVFPFLLIAIAGASVRIPWRNAPTSSVPAQAAA